MTDIKILIVEDEQIVGKFIEKQLTGSGYSVVNLVTSGEEAIKNISELRPDIVLMDIKIMGSMDGIETADHIRKKFQIPVIFLTSLADDESFQRAKLAEPFGYLIKPIDLKEFNRTVEIALYKNKIYNELIDARHRFQIAAEAARTRVWELWIEEDKLILDSDMPSLFGYTEDDIEHIDINRMKFVYDEDRDFVLKTIAGCLEGKSKSFEIEHRIYEKEGSVGWLLLRGVHVPPDNNKPRRIIGSATDITEQKNYEVALRKSEEKFRNIFESSGIGMAILGPDGQFTKVNNSFCEMMGYNEDEIIGINFRDITHPGDLDKSVKLTMELLKNESVESNLIEKRYLNKRGELIWALTTISLIRDSDGKPLFFIAQAQDITKRKKYEEQLLNYTDELKVLNASKDKFFSIISHDLRTPFNSLLGITEFIAQSYDEMSPKEIKDSIGNIYQSSHKVYNLILNLFEWTRLQIGKFEVEKTNINLKELIEETINLYKPNADQKGIKLLNNSSNEIFVYADKYMIETVLRNLITNAIKFSYNGGTVKVNAVTKGNAAEVTVTDNGVGISDENQKKLFRIDVQFKSYGTADEKGTGLGLILCKEFVEKNGGNISVDSKEGKGSKFIFSIPLANS